MGSRLECLWNSALHFCANEEICSFVKQEVAAHVYSSPSQYKRAGVFTTLIDRGAIVGWSHDWEKKHRRPPFIGPVTINSAATGAHHRLNHVASPGRRDWGHDQRGFTHRQVKPFGVSAALGPLSLRKQWLYTQQNSQARSRVSHLFFLWNWRK